MRRSGVLKTIISSAASASYLLKRQNSPLGCQEQTERVSEIEIFYTASGASHSLDRQPDNPPGVQETEKEDVRIKIFHSAARDSYFLTGIHPNTRPAKDRQEGVKKSDQQLNPISRWIRLVDCNALAREKSFRLSRGAIKIPLKSCTACSSCVGRESKELVATKIMHRIQLVCY